MILKILIFFDPKLNLCKSDAYIFMQQSHDLVKRNFNADHPDQLWVSDFTYIQTHSGWVYTAFIIDVFSRAIVGWKVSTRMNTSEKR